MSYAEELEARLRELAPRERGQLELLRERLKAKALTPEEIGKLLPEAVPFGEKEGHGLSESMIEVTERAIDLSIQHNPENLSTAFFPIIGAAIRKAINKLMADLMSSMNASLESALSFKRLAWRWEAWRKHIPYSELVLQHTLRYRVDHIFLIHNRTGLLLRSLSRPPAAVADDDMVASMLTVVKDYIKDSLSLKKAEAVNVISVGAYNVIVEEGPKALIAAVVRGAPDIELRSHIQESLETIHRSLGSILERFSGETEPFSAADAWLKSCLLSRDLRPAGRKPVYAIILVALALAAAAVAISFGLIGLYRRGSAVKALEAEPGIMVAAARGRFGPDELRLLRDPRARPAAQVLQEKDIDARSFVLREEAFYSPELGSPAAPAERPIPEELLAIARELSGFTLLFEQDSEELREGQEDIIRQAGSLINDLVEKAKTANFNVIVELTGHSAGSVADDLSYAISQERAQKAMDLFTELNQPLVRYVRTRGVGIDEPLAAEELTEEDRVRNRSVTFKALIE